MGGLIPQKTGPKHKRGTKLLFSDYRYLKQKNLLVRDSCPGFHKKSTPRSAWKIKRKRLPEDYPAENPGDLIVLDSIVEYVGPNFKKLYFVYCTDIATRIAFAMATETHNSKVTRELLQKMEYILQTPIKAVLTDNGSEFPAYFHKACTDQQIEHFFTRPRTPKDSAVAERFNKTL